MHENSVSPPKTGHGCRLTRGSDGLHSVGVGAERVSLVKGDSVISGHFSSESIGVTVAKLELGLSVLVVQLRSCPEFWCSKQAISLTSNVYMKIKE